MNGVTAVMLVVLALGGPARAPDLQVEASSTAGVGLPELTEAVARALVAGGARVVLRPPASEPCSYCAKVVVVESGGTCRVEVSQERHRAKATLRLPPGSPLLDRARAIAIQARLLVTWDTNLEAKSREVAARPPARRSDGNAPAERSVPVAEVARAELVPPAAIPARAPLPSLPLEPERGPAREPVAVGRPLPASPSAPPKAAVRVETRPAARADAKPAVVEERERVETARKPTVDMAREAPPEDERKPLAEPARAEADSARAMELTTLAPATRKPQWPWIPTAIGAGAAVAAGICGVVARDRYEALSDRRHSYASARAFKSEGENWQLASFVLAGVAVAGIGTGVVGFAARSPVVVAAPAPGGGMVTIAGGLP